MQPQLRYCFFFFFLTLCGCRTTSEKPDPSASKALLGVGNNPIISMDFTIPKVFDPEPSYEAIPLFELPRGESVSEDKKNQAKKIIYLLQFLRAIPVQNPSFTQLFNSNPSYQALVNMFFVSRMPKELLASILMSGEIDFYKNKIVFAKTEYHRMAYYLPKNISDLNFVPKENKRHGKFYKEHKKNRFQWEPEEILLKDLQKQLWGISVTKEMKRCTVRGQQGYFIVKYHSMFRLPEVDETQVLNILNITNLDSNVEVGKNFSPTTKVQVKLYSGQLIAFNLLDNHKIFQEAECGFADSITMLESLYRLKKEKLAATAIFSESPDVFLSSLDHIFYFPWLALIAEN